MGGRAAGMGGAFIGLNLSYGKGTDLSPNNLNFSDLKPTSSSQFLVYLFLASAYEF